MYCIVTVPEVTQQEYRENEVGLSRLWRGGLGGGSGGDTRRVSLTLTS